MGAPISRIGAQSIPFDVRGPEFLLNSTVSFAIFMGSFQAEISIQRTPEIWQRLVSNESLPMGVSGQRLLYWALYFRRKRFHWLDFSYRANICVWKRPTLLVIQQDRRLTQSSIVDLVAKDSQTGDVLQGQRLNRGWIHYRTAKEDIHSAVSSESECRRLVLLLPSNCCLLILDGHGSYCSGELTFGRLFN